MTGEQRSVPADDASDLDWFRFAQDDVLSWRQATGELGRHRVKNRVAGRRWQRPHRGTVVVHSGPLTGRQRIWAGVLAAGRDAVCGGLTAATLEGLRGYDRPVVELLIPAGRRVAPLPGVRLHRTSILPVEHVRWSAGPPRTVMARSVVDAAAWARTDADARAVVAAAIQQRRVRPEAVGTVVAVMPRVRRRALVLETVRLAAGGAHSVAEIDLVNLCRRFSLPAPDQQRARRDAGGRVRYLDAYWADWGVHAEVDGAWHVEVRAWWADMQRQNDLWIAGDRVLRFPAWAIRNDQRKVAEQIRSALSAAGWRR